MQITKKIDIDKEINEIEVCNEIIKTFDLTLNIESSLSVQNESKETYNLDSLFGTNSICKMDDSIESESFLNEDNQMILTDNTNDLSEKEVNQI